MCHTDSKGLLCACISVYVCLIYREVLWLRIGLYPGKSMLR